VLAARPVRSWAPPGARRESRSPHAPTRNGQRQAHMGQAEDSEPLADISEQEDTNSLGQSLNNTCGPPCPVSRVERKGEEVDACTDISEQEDTNSPGQSLSNTCGPPCPVSRVERKGEEVQLATRVEQG
jgi:hypothetical protein